MQKHAVLHMVADSAGQYEVFQIAAQALEFARWVGVGYPGGFLVDDRAFIQLRGDIVCGRAD